MWVYSCCDMLKVFAFHFLNNGPDFRLAYLVLWQIDIVASWNMQLKANSDVYIVNLKQKVRFPLVFFDECFDGQQLQLTK